MSLVVVNNSSRDMSIVKELAEKYYPYAQKVMGFNRSAKLYFESDMSNAKNPLGKTAFYNPDSSGITIYVDERHPKDIMRSFSHELVHHAQNCQGQFNNSGPTEEGYAQKDPHLREMEEDAYRRGNLCFRDWENQYNLKEIKTKMEKSFTSKELRTVIQGALQQILEARGVESFEDLEEAADTEVEDINEEEEELEEGGAADRPENKDKHVAAPDRGRRVHVNEDGDIDPLEEEEEIEEYKRTNVNGREVGRSRLDPGTHEKLREDEEELEEVRPRRRRERPPEEGGKWQGTEQEKAVKAAAGEKPDFPDIDKDGDTDEPITKAAKEKEALKEWYDGSIYGKLLKEWTKGN